MPTENATILLVDDERAIRDSVKRVLRKEKHHFLEAGNGQEALQVIANQSADLILLDLEMPKMDGFTFLERFRALEMNKSIPVCVMTGGSEKGYRRRAIELGADDFIQKPTETVELKTRIKSLLRSGRYHNELLDLNTRLEERVDERTSELCTSLRQLQSAQQEIDLAYRETVLRLTLAAEMKDKCTAGHLERMSHYSALLAARKGWSTADVDLLTEAAKMHDIGKLGVPDAILNKCGKLTREEFALMQQHTEIGSRILAGSRAKLLKMGAIIALTHHERFDGTGYPHQLAGNAIPEAGRIVAIADVFDALMSRRSYKDAWSLDDTLSKMRAESGRHFDPSLLTLFLDDIGALREIHDRYKEGSRFPVGV